MSSDLEFAQFESWRPPDQLQLVEVPPISAPLCEVNPEAVRLERVGSSTLVFLQAALSRAPWKPRFRNLAYIVRHGEAPIAILCLSSPVINRIAVRDAHLGLTADDVERGKQLRHYADLSVCVGIQPLAWHWNIGKLGALLALTVGDDWQEAYGDDLRGIVTTSLYGRGSQYNRIYKFLGYTTGRGTSHVPDYVFDAIRQRLRSAGRVPSSGTNSRKKLIDAYHVTFGKTIPRYGDRRAVYYRATEPTMERRTLVGFWYERWGRPRYERTSDWEPPYTDGKTEIERVL